MSEVRGKPGKSDVKEAREEEGTAMGNAPERLRKMETERRNRGGTREAVGDNDQSTRNAPYTVLDTETAFNRSFFSFLPSFIHLFRKYLLRTY